MPLAISWHQTQIRQPPPVSSFLLRSKAAPRKRPRRPVPLKRSTIQRRPKNRAPWWQLLPVRRTIVGSGLNWTLTTTSGKGRGPCLPILRSEEHTSELQSLMRISYAVFCLKKKKTQTNHSDHENNTKDKV